MGTDYTDEERKEGGRWQRTACRPPARTKKILPVVLGAPPSPAADLTYALPEMTEEKEEGILGNPVVPKTNEEWGLWEQALLKVYAPDSEDILRVNSALQPSMIRDGWLADVSQPVNFTQFFMIPSHNVMLTVSPIAVHELSHVIHGLFPVVLQSQKKLPRNKHYLVYYLGKNRIMPLLKTDTIPSRDIASGIPKPFKDAGPMVRYNRYILSANDNQTTQAEGIYGLLDELCASYHRLRTAWELYPSFRGRLPQTAQNYFTYYNIVSDQYLACAQFTLYILLESRRLFSRPHERSIRIEYPKPRRHSNHPQKNESSFFDATNHEA